MRKALVGIGMIMELGSILGLAAIGLKRNNDCYKAECKLADSELKRVFSEIEGMLKDAEIRALKQELEQLKNKHKEEEA